MTNSQKQANLVNQRATSQKSSFRTSGVLPILNAKNACQAGAAPLHFCILALCLLFFLTACDAPPPAADAADEQPAAQNITPPDQIAAAFLQGWQNKNYEGMYNYVAQPSRELYPYQVFSARYTVVDQEVGIESIAYTITGTTLQGESAVVRYDLTLTSPRFGSITDAGRRMRLVLQADGWRVAWSTLDIFDGLAPDGQVRVDTVRAPRANIYDVNGLPLAEANGTSVSVFVARQNMIGEIDCLNILAVALRRPFPELQAFVNGFNNETIFYIGDMDFDTYARRRADIQTFCGSSEDNGLVRLRTTRVYYGNGAAAHITGYISPIQPGEESAGYLQGDLRGRTGIEEAYERELGGQPTSTIRIVTAGGTTVRELASTTGRAPTPVLLTIDRNLQMATANALNDAFQYALPNWAAPGRSPGGAAVVLDVNSGAILAMASYPTFNPGMFNPDVWGYIFDAQAYIAGIANDPRRPLRNRAVQEQYPPGSTFKIITTAAMAEEGLFAPDEIFDCTHQWEGARFGDTLPVRYDWTYVDGLPPTGPVTISGALTTSCNPFYYQSGARLYNEIGPDALVRYARLMGLGAPTGLPSAFGEASGNLAPPNSVEAAINSAIGQNNIQVTALQMAHMVGGVATGGTLFKPFIVQQVGGVDGTPVEFVAQPQIAGQMNLSPETFAVLHEGMCNVVADTERGTARFAYQGLTGYTACGKTGTAQSGRIEPHAWFVVYAPAENPQVAIAVVVENSREGSEVAAPISRRILDYYFNAPVAPYFAWWTESYVELNVPEGGTAGG